MKKDIETTSEIETETVSPNKLSASNINEIFRLRFHDKLTEREIAEKTGVSLSSVNRMLKDIETPGNVETQQNSPPQQLDINMLRELFRTTDIDTLRGMLRQGNVGPRAYYEVPPRLWESLGTKIDKKNVEGWKQNVILWNEMRAQQAVQTHNGHGNPIPQYSFGDPVKDALAEAIRRRTEERTMKWLFTDEENKPKSEMGMKEMMMMQKNTIDMLKVNKGGNGGGTIGEFVKLFLTMQNNNWDFFQKQQAILSSVPSGEMKDETRIALKKLDIGMKQWMHEQSASAEKWKAIQMIAGGALGQIPDAIGALRGQAGSPQKTKQICPKCGKPFMVPVKILENEIPFPCPICGERLKPKSAEELKTKEPKTEEKEQGGDQTTSE